MPPLKETPHLDTSRLPGGPAYSMDIVTHGVRSTPDVALKDPNTRSRGPIV